MNLSQLLVRLVMTTDSGQESIPDSGFEIIGTHNQDESIKIFEQGSKFSMRTGV